MVQLASRELVCEVTSTFIGEVISHLKIIYKGATVKQKSKLEIFGVSKEILASLDYNQQCSYELKH